MIRKEIILHSRENWFQSCPSELPELFTTAVEIAISSEKTKRLNNKNEVSNTFNGNFPLA